jgi:hyperosmotically inducible protein
MILATLAGFAVTSLACSSQTADEALDASRDGAATAIEEIHAAADATSDAAGELTTATGEAITDTWITTRISVMLVDEALLEGSNIDVDTDAHVVTLRGTVASEAAKNRAAVIAGDIEGVTHVVNELVVS